MFQKVAISAMAECVFDEANPNPSKMALAALATLYLQFTPFLNTPQATGSVYSTGT